MTANLQTGLTTKQAAQLMNVSERSVYLARKLVRSGRADLCAAVERGELSLHAALKQIEPPRRKDTLKPVVLAWNAATPGERQAILNAVDEFSVRADLQICSRPADGGDEP
jgi:predicted DNA-binding transcriptional regulator YafY